ncbi:MAG: ribonuclease HII [Candidatus Thermoplasmatota archaeon]|nr:ribonuclease HII [Candidatus Thermoplasmatota archaeon]
MICGIDEAGRGPVIGPMVVAGVWAEEEKEIALRNMNVKDSKKHSKKRREELSEKIREMFFYDFVVVQPEDIDALRNTMSLNDLEIHIFVKIGRSKKANVYYLDSADVNEERFGQKFSEKLGFDADIISRHKADVAYPIVSAASIVAKVERDRKLKEITDDIESKLDVPLGSGYPSDERTRIFIKKWIEKFGDAPPYTRRSWSTVKKIKMEMKQKRLL